MNDEHLAVGESGSLPDLESGHRRFESCQLDHLEVGDAVMSGDSIAGGCKPPVFGHGGCKSLGPHQSDETVPSPRGQGQLIVDQPSVGSNPTGIAKPEDWLDEYLTYWGLQQQ